MLRKVLQTFRWNPLLVVLGLLVILSGRLRELPKRGGVLGRQMFSMRVEREIAHLSTEEAQAEKSKDFEEGNLSILRMEEEAHDRDAVLLGTQG